MLAGDYRVGQTFLSVADRDSCLHFHGTIRRPTTKGSTRMRNNSVESLEARRLLSAGAIDHSFGIDGTVTGSISLPKTIALSSLVAADVAVGSDGKKWVVGSIGQDPGPTLVFVARFNRDGSRDSAFGEFGAMTFAWRAGNIEPSAIALDASGRAVVAGTVEDKHTGHSSFFLARVRWH